MHSKHEPIPATNSESDPQELPSQVPRRKTLRRSRIVWAAASAMTLLGGAVIWKAIERHEDRVLARNSRVVIRFPEEVIDDLTPQQVTEEFPINEEAAGMQVTGTAKAIGNVKVNIEEHVEPGGIDDALVTVKVTGTTDDDFTGENSLVTITADGQGTFEAEKTIHFNGLKFETEGDTEVSAQHEAEIVTVEPSEDTSWKGAVKLLATRRAKASLPQLNEIASERIKETVADRVDELVDETVDELNRINRFDGTVAALHPDSKNWRIGVRAGEDYLEAALVPEGARMPHISDTTPDSIELWVKLTRSQRLGLGLADRWGLSQTLLKSYLPSAQAAHIPDKLRITRVKDWTRFQVGLETLHSNGTAHSASVSPQISQEDADDQAATMLLITP